MLFCGGNIERYSTREGCTSAASDVVDVDAGGRPSFVVRFGLEFTDAVAELDVDEERFGARFDCDKSRDTRTLV